MARGAAKGQPKKKKNPWKNVEEFVELHGHIARRNVFWGKKKTLPTVKHGWTTSCFGAFFSATGTGPLIWVVGLLNSSKKLSMLAQNLKANIKKKKEKTSKINKGMASPQKDQGFGMSQSGP